MGCNWFIKLGSFLLMLLLQWRDCVIRGIGSSVNLGSTALFVILWSWFLSLNSPSSLVYILPSLGVAGAAIHCMGYIPGFSIVGLFGILIMWRYDHFFCTGMVLIVGGYIFSLNYARLLIFMSIAYAVYCVNARVGWPGVFLSLNLSFLSNDLLIKLRQEYEGISEGTHYEEHKESEPVIEELSGDSESSPPPEEAENMASKMSTTSFFLNIQKDSSSSRVDKADSSSLDEMKRIIGCSNHYEALGFPQNKEIDLTLLRKEYLKKAMLVHPDKNIGDSLANESFKKLQCAYEVLSDTAKKEHYDEQLRKEESRRACEKSHATSQQDVLEYRPNESRCIECTKCGNKHLWICTNRSKANARWCKGCSQYHRARDGEGWVECGCSVVFSTAHKVEIPRAFACAESKIFDVSEWVICRGMECMPNTHLPTFRVIMVPLEKTVQTSNPSKFSWRLDAEMIP